MKTTTVDQLTVGSKIVVDGVVSEVVFIKVTTKMAQVTFRTENGNVWGGRQLRTTEYQTV